MALRPPFMSVTSHWQPSLHGWRRRRVVFERPYAEHLCSPMLARKRRHFTILTILQPRM